MKPIRWGGFAQMRASIPTADSVTLPNGNVITVFNIGGFRLLTHVKYNTSQIFIKELLNHDDYDQGGWRTRLDYD